MIFFLRSTIITMWLFAPKVAQLQRAKGNSRLCRCGSLTGSHTLILIENAHGCLIGGYTLQNWLKINGHSAFLTESTRQTCFSLISYNEKNTVFSTLLEKTQRGDSNDEKQKSLSWAPVHGELPPCLR